MTIRRLVGGGRLLGVLLIGILIAIMILVAFIVGHEPPLRQDTYEAVLRTNLRALRESIAEFHEDQGRGPESLQALVAAGYLRQLPVDPMSGNSSTWDVEMADDGAIVDVHSASEDKALDGSLYGDW